MDDRVLSAEDFEEPRCPLCTDHHKKTPQPKRIPLDRVMQKLDEHLSRNDYVAAERHLTYWLDEATVGGDERGAFALHNELMGLHRKCGRREQAIAHAEQALALADRLQIGNTAGGATAYLNAATVYKAFDMPQQSLPLFEKARAVYEQDLDEDDPRLGGLYNNMGLTLVDLHRFDEAMALYRLAVAVMERVKDGEPEQAITYLNMANAVEAQVGLEAGEERIGELISTAMALLDTESLPQNGNYAFVCEKCAPTFGYYGYFAYQHELEKRARSIYERP